MTRTDAIATITRHIEAADDQLLERVAAHLEGRSLPAMTVGEALEALTTDSIMPRQLTARELELIEQSKADFRDGRTLTHDQAMARTDAFLAARRASRARS